MSLILLAPEPTGPGGVGVGTFVALAVAVVALVVVALVARTRRLAAEALGHGPVASDRVVVDRRLAVVIALGAAALCAAAVIALLDGVFEQADLSAFDGPFSAAVAARRVPWMTSVAQGATFLGGTLPVAGMLLLLIVWLLVRHRAWRLAVFVTITMAVSAAVTVGLKLLIERARPTSDLRIGVEDMTFSFPSGHTLNSTVLAGLVAGLVLLACRSWWTRALVVAAWFAIVGTIGFSRIYLGYHWLTDVLAGWLTGVGLLALAAAVALAWPVLVARPDGERAPVEASSPPMSIDG